MLRKWISLLTCLSFIGYLWGCSTTHTVTMDEFQRNPEGGIEKVILVDGRVIEFDTRDGVGGVLRDDQIVGITRLGDAKRIPVADVQMVYYAKPDAGKSALLVVGVIAAAALVAAVLFAAALGDAFHDAVH